MNKNDFKILIVYPNIPMMLVTPLAVAIFTWILRKEGFIVSLFDTTQYTDGNLSSPQNRAKYLQARNIFSERNLALIKDTDMEKDFKKQIESFKPDLLIYSFAEDSLQRALQLLRVSNPYKITTIAGGILATSAPELLISFPEISIIGVGEGEEVVREVALRLSQGQDIKNIPNLWLKQPDGSIIKNPPRPYVNLSAYSTDFSIFNEDRFERPMGGKIHRALPMETYRGCPNQCAYCNSPMHNRIAKQQGKVYLRRRPVEWIIKEVKHLVNDYKINLLYIVDDTFLARPKQEIEEFIEIYKEIRIPFWFNTRPETCTLEMLNKLKEVGLFRISLGIESGNEQFRKDILHRNISNDKLVEYFNAIDLSGVSYSINCVIGFPYETREMIFDTIRFAKKIKGYDSITVSIFTPYRGTELRDKAIKEGWLNPDKLTTHTTARSMLDMPFLTAKEIDGLMQTFSLYVEFDESHWPEIKKIEKFEPGSEKLLAHYSDLYAKIRWKQENCIQKGV